MPVQEMRKWKQKTLLGVSLKVLAPTGQYDPTKLVNWAPTAGPSSLSLAIPNAGASCYSMATPACGSIPLDPRFYSRPVPKPQTQEPIGSFEGHLSYDVKPRFWFSLDGNFWFGGVTSLSGIANPATHQTSSRIGATASFPVTKTQSIKVSYNDGAYIRFGGNYQSISVAWHIPG